MVVIINNKLFPWLSIKQVQSCSMQACGTRKHKGSGGEAIVLCKICNDVQKSLPFSDYFEVIFVSENAAMTDEYDRRGKRVPTFVFNITYCDQLFFLSTLSKWAWSRRVWGAFQDNHLLTVCPPRKIKRAPLQINEPESENRGPSGRWKQVFWWMMGSVPWIMANTFTLRIYTTEVLPTLKNGWAKFLFLSAEFGSERTFLG